MAKALLQPETPNDVGHGYMVIDAKRTSDYTMINPLVPVWTPDGAIGANTVTYDFARLMEGAKELKCSEFGDAVIVKM